MNWQIFKSMKKNDLDNLINKISQDGKLNLCRLCFNFISQTQSIYKIKKFIDILTDSNFLYDFLSHYNFVSHLRFSITASSVLFPYLS